MGRLKKADGGRGMMTTTTMMMSSHDDRQKIMLFRVLMASHVFVIGVTSFVIPSTQTVQHPLCGAAHVPHVDCSVLSSSSSSSSWSSVPSCSCLHGVPVSSEMAETEITGEANGLGASSSASSSASSASSWSSSTSSSYSSWLFRSLRWRQRHHRRRRRHHHRVEEMGGGEEDVSWLSWMTRGKPRGVEDVKHRSPVELGGVARSDRYASRDWFHNTVSMPKSGVLRAIRSPVIAMSSWATFVALVYRHLLKEGHVRAAANMCLPGSPHSLMVSALGLLLVFRTNSAYQRFNEGRQIWESIVNTSRDLYRMMVLYQTEIGVDKRRRIQRLLAAFPYLLRHRIRPNLVLKHGMGRKGSFNRLDDKHVPRDPGNSIILYQDAAAFENDVEAAVVATDEETTGFSRRRTRPLYWVDRRTLPWRLLPPGALEKCARSQNRPLWVCDRISKELCTVPDGPNFTARERLALIGHADKLSRCVGACERIHQTAVPLNYARHSLRGLTLWLFSLPFALIRDVGVLTGPVIFLISWLLFGIYEIGYAIEDPFQGTLRLSILCDTIRRDVLGDEFIRETAFQLEPEPGAIHPNEDDDDDDDDEEEHVDDDNNHHEDGPYVIIRDTKNAAIRIEDDIDVTKKNGKSRHDTTTESDEMTPKNGNYAPWLNPMQPSTHGYE